jgi:hypothetical protein
MIKDALSKYTKLVAISDSTTETVAKAIFTGCICQYGGPEEIILNQVQEFCMEVTIDLYKVKLTPKAGAQFPTFYFQEKTANQKIDKYLKLIFELTTTNWEIYLAPLMLSYNTSFNRTFKTSPHFIIFGQHARQPAFNHGNWEKKHLGEFFGGRKVSKAANNPPGGLAGCRAPTANEFQNLQESISCS